MERERGGRLVRCIGRREGSLYIGGIGRGSTWGGG
jgi:hypothetical protein